MVIAKHHPMQPGSSRATPATNQLPRDKGRRRGSEGRKKKTRATQLTPERSRQ